MHVELRPITTIRPYANNPRLNDQAVEAVAASLREFGFRQPLVIDEEGVLVVGHTRFRAALQLGLEMVPVHVATGLTPAQIKAYRLADNQTATLSRWDEERLPLELIALQQQGFDLKLTGFSAEDLLRLLEPPTQGQTDRDDVPEPPDEPTTQPGDRWQLGRHSLLCGDSGQPSHVDLLLEGAPVHLAVIDPPYHVGLEPRTRQAIAAGFSSFEATQHHAALDPAQTVEKAQSKGRKLRARDRPLANDSVSDEEFARLLQDWFGNLARVLQPGGVFYIFGGYSNVAAYPAVLKSSGLYFSQAIIWLKGHPVLNRKDYMGDHEWCFYGWREGAAHRFYGPANATDVWSIKKVNPQLMVHLTQKPVELAARAMEYSSRPGDSVLDLFAGSGSTLIAAEQAGRRAFLMEIDGLYCDVIISRWERFTGQKAVRVRTCSE
jgi:DNA modification methylase